MVQISENGISFLKISQVVKVAKSTVQNDCRKFRLYGNTSRLEWSERPKSDAVDHIIKVMKKNPNATTIEINQNFKIKSVHNNQQTVETGCTFFDSGEYSSLQTFIWR